MYLLNHDLQFMPIAIYKPTRAQKVCIYYSILKGAPL